jgi:tRNA (cmo5U34)-methyltransferase
MEARGLGVDAIAFVLDETFPGICIEIGGGTFERTWHRKSDPYYCTGPGGRIRTAELEIAQKRQALENVLIPYRVSDNLEMLKGCGFVHVEMFFRWFNFAGFIATKT